MTGKRTGERRREPEKEEGEGEGERVWRGRGLKQWRSEAVMATGPDWQMECSRVRQDGEGRKDGDEDDGKRERERMNGMDGKREREREGEK